MCIMLQKKQGLLKIVQDRGHITQVRTLLKKLREADSTTSFVPVDDNAEDQTPLLEIPMNASSIWRKDLRPYICCNNCHFGNQNAVSFRIRIKTESKASSYAIGSWVQENLANAIKANVFLHF